MKKMNQQGLAIAAISAAAFISLQAQANDDLRINGFLTIGAGQMLDDELSIAGYTDEEIAMNLDTTLGLQFTKPINESVTLNAQLTGRTGEPSYDIEATWAFANIQLTESLALRAGRFRLPYYMYSEYVDVSYAYPWIRPPAGFELDFSDLDGLDILYNTYIGDADLTLEGYYGRYKYVNGGAVATVEDLVGGVATIAIDSITVRLSAHTLALTTQNFPAAGLNIESDSATFYEAGIIYDDFQNFAFVEYTNAVLPDNFIYTTSYSNIIATYGYRIGNLMPHITYDRRMQPDGNAFVPGDQDYLKTSIIAGARWDFSPSTSFKVQYQADEKTLSDTTTNGSLISLALDLVF